MEIEDGMLKPDLSIFLSYVNAIGIDGRQLIDWEKHTNVYMIEAKSMLSFMFRLLDCVNMPT